MTDDPAQRKTLGGRVRVAKWIIAAAVVLAANAAAQPYGLSPTGLQYFDNNGVPLAGGLIYTCASGSSCPGTPAATYTDASAFTALPNPIVLDSSGRTAIWLNTTLQYKFVIKTSAGVTITTIDNISASSSGGGTPSAQYWVLSGSDISNSNGGGAGNVGVGANLSVAGNLILTGTLNLRNGLGSPNYAHIRANSTMAADVTWRWPALDAIGVLTSDGAGNLTFAPGGGGGSGTPGGVNNNVQFNNNGSFGGSSNMRWDNTLQLLSVYAVDNAHASIAAGTGFIQADTGFLATPATGVNYNIFNAPAGGMHALSFTADKYIQAGNNSGTPTLTALDTFHPGAMYYDTGAHALKVFNDSSAWVNVALGGATSPGGANTNVQFNSAGSFGGSANLTFASQLLNVIAASSSVAGINVQTGFIQSDGGFVANPGTATTYNSIQAPSGGLFGKSLTALNYVQTGNSNGVPALSGLDSFHAGAMYWDITLGAERVFNGSSWASIGTGGSGTPGGLTTTVQYNNSGAFAGDGTFTWNTGSRLLTVTTSGATAGIVVVNGYIQSDTGFLATPATAVSSAAIQAPGGGMTAKSFSATNYVKTGSWSSGSSGTPPLTTGDSLAPGLLSWDNTTATLKVYNGSAMVAVSGGGGSVASLNGLTGALTIAGTANEITVTPSGSTITLSTPQPIGTASAVSFASVNTTGVMNSSATGSSLAFSANGGTFVVNGAGTVSAINLNLNGGTGTGLNVTANTDAFSIQTRGGINTCDAGTCAGASALSVNGNLVINSLGVYTGAISTPSSSSSVLTIGPLGNFYNRTIGASSGVSCAAVNDGWAAVSSDDFLVVCMGGSRFRASLVSF